MKILIILLTVILFDCSSKKKNDQNQLAALGYLLLSSTSSSCTTTIGTGVADWVKKSFTCVTVSVSGNNYIFKTTSVPDYKSYYFGKNSSSYESSLYSSSNFGNPNTIKAQDVSITIPISNTSTSASSTGFGTIGIATNGISIYNDQAAPGDSLTTEYSTFDTAQGHPTNTGSYHYHVEPPKISSSDSKLVGILADGYLIFGKLHDTTSSGLTTGFTLGIGNSSTKCTGSNSQDTTLPTSWDYKSNYESTTGHDSTNSHHYHVNNGSGVNAILISGKYIDAKL